MRKTRTHRKLLPFDAARYLTDDAAVAEYLNAVLESGDSDLLLLALGDIARARGMAQIAKDTGLGRESLYKALAPGAKPRFDTILKVARALGVKLSAQGRSRRSCRRWSQSIRQPTSSISLVPHPYLIHPGVHSRALRCTTVHSTSAPTPRESWKPQQRRPPAVRRWYCYESEGHWFKSSRARQKVKAPRAVSSRGLLLRALRPSD